MIPGLTQAQLELRRTGITASEIAALVGLSRWATPIQIYEEKTVPGQTKQANLKMKLGNLLEEPVCQLYLEHTGRKYLSHPGTIRSTRHDFVLATPDRAVHSVFQRKKATWDWENVERLLQVKTTDWRARPYWKDPLEDPTGVPTEVLAQTTWEMGAAEQNLCDVAVLFDREEFRVYTVPFDRAFFEMLLEAGQRFMVDHVLARVPPPPDASEQYAGFLNRRYPGERLSDLREATPEIEALAEELRQTESELKRLEGLKSEQQNTLKAFIGEFVGVLTSHGKTTWKKTKDGMWTNWEAIARELLTEACPKDSPDEMCSAWLDTFQRIVAAHSVPVVGYRRLYKPWSREKK